MKILHVNTQDNKGGAARAAYRLHKALLHKGIDSKMLVQSKNTDDYTVNGPDNIFGKSLGKIRPTLDRLPLSFYNTDTGRPFSFGFFPLSRMVNKINEINPNIVHLHWVAGGMLNLNELHKVNAPIVWTLHDNWPVTGGCHVKWDCENYKEGCGHCPVLNSNSKNDLSRLGFYFKRKNYKRTKNLTFIGLSSWMTDLIKKSPLSSDHQVNNIPNLLDTDIYSPVEKKTARTLLNLDPNKKYILFGAIKALNDTNKGFAELKKAIELSTFGDDIELLIFGSSKPQRVDNFRKYQTHYFGHVYDDLTLKILYSAADVMIVPSKQESFGQTAIESMACGTPVVAFGTTGLLDIIDHKKNGYLAKPYDPKDLAKGISWILNSEARSLIENGRQKILKSFSHKIVTESYVNLYHSVNKDL